MLETQQKSNGTSLENISSTLSSLRKEKNISIDAISEQTRIKPEYLKKLEENDFKFLPAPYVYAMLKVYGHFLEIDEQKIINCRGELDILTDEALHDLVKSNQAENGHFNFDISNISLKQWGIYGGTFFGIVFLIALIMFIFTGSKDEPAVVVKTSEPKPAMVSTTQQSSDNTPAPPTLKSAPVPKAPVKETGKTLSAENSAKSSETKTPKTAETQEKINQASISVTTTNDIAALPTKRLNIKALADTSWVKVVSGDGSISAEALLLPNQQRQYTAKGGYEITIGRAQAVNISLDGQPVSKPRSSGWIKFNVGK